MNNKSRIALAIAAALGTAAMGASAQTSSVQIGGALSLLYGASKAGGLGSSGTPVQGKNHDSLALSEPEIFVHGEEKIGSDLTAWFRCTSSFDLMGGATAGTSTGGQWCGRNSGMGFKGGFGNLFFGNWDAPQKDPIALARGWWSGVTSFIGGTSQLLYNGSASDVGNGNSAATSTIGATFNRRQNRLISYYSPNFGGFDFKAAYSSQNEATNLTTVALGNLSPRMASFSSNYSNGPLKLSMGYERHMDFNPGALTVATTANNSSYSGGTDSNFNFAAAYKFGSTTSLRGTYSRSKYDVSNVTDIKKAGWGIYADHELGGGHTIRMQYASVGDSKGSHTASGAVALVGGNGANIAAAGVDTGAKAWGLAYSYAMSKRTELSVAYSVTDNDANSRMGKGVTTVNTGETQKGYGINLRHKF